MTKQDTLLASSRAEDLNSCFKNHGVYGITAYLAYVAMDGCKTLHPGYIAEIESRYNLKFDHVVHLKDGIRAIFEYA